MKIDNLILIGSPTKKESELFKDLSSNENIKNIIRVDIPGDNITQPTVGVAITFIILRDNHPHFIYAFGTAVAENQEKLGARLRDEGVE